METQVFFLLDSFLDDIKSAFFVTGHIASDRSLNIPRSPFIDRLFSHSKCVVNDTFLESHAEEEFSDSIDVGAVVRMLHNSLTRF